MAPRRSENSDQVTGDAKTADESPVSEGPIAGRYLALEEIGRGGMGRVLRAYDPALQREVALKEARRATRSRDQATRLVAEARAMARLSHPNVVSVFDVEPLDDGRVVVVMEYVAGPTLHTWLRGRPRGGREILTKFVTVGNGLAAAHRAGIVHGDFKSTNVLVAEDGTWKVADFGLAEAYFEATLATPSSFSEEDRTEATEPGWVLGTARYMAPEQLRPRVRTSSSDPGLTPAIDQYAFCVALWEALCGTAPFDGTSMQADKERGPPAWPEASTPRPVVNALMRGLSPDPDDRWPSMTHLLEALSWDAARRRRRWMVGFGSIGILAAVGVGSLSGAETSSDQCSGAGAKMAAVWGDTRSAEVEAAILGIDKSFAAAVWERTRRDLDIYREVWVKMHTEACEATTVRHEQSAEVMELRMGCLRRAALELGATVDILANADEQVVRNAHSLTSGLPPLSRCSDIDALSAAVELPSPNDAKTVEVIRQFLAEAKAEQSAGRFPAALEAVRSAETLLPSVDYEPVGTEVALRKGMVLDELADYDEARSSLGRALRLALRERQEELMHTAALQLLYVVGNGQRQSEVALSYARLARALTGGDPIAEADAADALGVVLQQGGHYAEAEEQHRTAWRLREGNLGPNHPAVATARGNLGTALQQAGKYEQAEAQFRRVVALRMKSLGPEHPSVGIARYNLGIVLDRLGKTEEAGEEFGVAVRVSEAALGADHPRVAQMRNGLAAVLYRQGKHADAVAEFRAAIAIQTKALGPDHPDVLNSRNNLAAVLYGQRNYDEAEAEYRAMLPSLTKSLGPEHPSVATAHQNLANIFHARGRFEQAENHHRTALAMREQALEPDHPDLAASRSHLAADLLALDRPAEALVLAEQAWARQQREDVPEEFRANTAFVLARALWDGRPSRSGRTRARELARQALESQRTTTARASTIREIERWLADHRAP